MSSVDPHHAGILVPFPPIEARPLRLAWRADEAGAVLLFTGVRYERAATEQPHPADGSGDRKSRPRSRRGR